jgi:tRNA (Thr-GGU) A37 N-methylase
MQIRIPIIFWFSKVKAWHELGNENVSLFCDKASVFAERKWQRSNTVLSIKIRLKDAYPYNRIRKILSSTSV